MPTANVISEASICSLAISRTGSTETISSLTEGSNAANQCLIWYPQDRDASLTDFPWPFAQAYIPLVEIAGPETTQDRANAVWMRSYRYPTDCLKMRRIVRTPFPLSAPVDPSTNYYQNEAWRRAVGDAVPVSYAMSSDADGRLITSDGYGPNGLTAVYTMAVQDPTIFDADFVDFLTWRLAADLAMPLGRDDAKRKYCQDMYTLTKGSTRAAHMNQTQSDIPQVRWQSETTRARWGRGRY